jgi:hypothetical protein
MARSLVGTGGDDFVVATPSPRVVPANAGTHTLRRFNLSEGVATPVFDSRFAGGRRREVFLSSA